MHTLFTPVAPAHPGGAIVLAGRTEWTAPHGLARAVLDSGTFDFHLDVSPELPTRLIPDLLGRIADLGLEPLSEDECEPELLEDGFTRIYMAPIVALNDNPLVPA